MVLFPKCAEGDVQTGKPLKLLGPQARNGFAIDFFKMLINVEKESPESSHGAELS
jgi:hypothetical protein